MLLIPHYVQYDVEYADSLQAKDVILRTYDNTEHLLHGNETSMFHRFSIAINTSFFSTPRSHFPSTWSHPISASLISINACN